MSDHDAVNHPGHYTSHPSGVECIQITEHMSFCLGNAVKYIWRADLKGNEIEDLRKARWYVDREIARLGGEPAVSDAPVAARLEAEAARDDYARELATVAVQSDAETLWGDLLPEDQADVIAQMRAVLDFLAADGRLLPEGGRDLLPCDRCNGSGSELAVSVPDGGPDGTPEKPWPTWQDVPDGVVYRGARDTSGWDGWFNRGGARHRFFDGAPSKTSDDMVDDEAPFVRVDGDKA
ncbi:DUF3310 domain-containing protein [Rhodococcus hoagii]|nr:DUF3310 domain-containing protein [Prescottella equi]